MHRSSPPPHAGSAAAGVPVEVVDLERVDELAHVADQVAALECAVRLQFVRTVAQLDAAGAPAIDGQTSLAAWLGFRYGLRSRTARETAAVAGVIAALPALAEAFGHGELSWDQLVPLCQLATPDTDAAWAADGPAIAPEDLWRMVRSRQVTEREAREVHQARGVTCRRHRAGGSTLTVRGEHTDIERALVLLDRIRVDEAGPDPDTGQWPPVPTQRYDAFVSLTSRELAADGDADRATVVVHADAHLLTGEGDTGAAVLADGTPVAAEVVRRHCCDGRIEWALDGPDGRALGIGRASRVWPAWLARQLRDRDQRCRFPGCTRPIHHLHHIRHWGHLGPTDDVNGIGLCVTHHGHVHEGGWRIEGDPNVECTFTSPYGRQLSSRPRRLTPEVKRRMQGVTPGLFETDP